MTCKATLHVPAIGLGPLACSKPARHAEPHDFGRGLFAHFCAERGLALPDVAAHLGVSERSAHRYLHGEPIPPHRLREIESLIGLPNSRILFGSYPTRGKRGPTPELVPALRRAARALRKAGQEGDASLAARLEERSGDRYQGADAAGDAPCILTDEISEADLKRYAAQGADAMKGA